MTVQCTRCCGTGRRRISRALRDVLEILVPGFWLSVADIQARFRGRWDRSITTTALCNRLRRLAEEGLAESMVMHRMKRGARPLLWKPVTA